MVHKIKSLGKKKLQMRYVHCQACGFSREIDRKDENWGYCVRRPCSRYKGEQFKIAMGKETETAEKCEYFRKRIKGMSDEAFVQFWAAVLYGEKTDHANRLIVRLSTIGILAPTIFYLLDKFYFAK